jgi:hypothetical protein
MSEKPNEDILLCQYIDQMVSQNIVDIGTYKADNLKFFDDYNRELYGDEEEGLSKYVSGDVFDTVESDHISLARVFLGAGAPVEFKAVNGNPEAIKEAEDKNAYINFILNNITDSYKKQSDWLKEGLIQRASYVEYGIRETKSVEKKKFEGLDRVELELKLDELRKEKDVKEVKIEAEIESDEQSFEFEVSVKKERKDFFLNSIPWEDMIIPSGIQCKNDAVIFGKRFKKRRGELVKDGISRELVKTIPTSSDKNSDDVKLNRYKDENGKEYDTTSLCWANEVVSGVDVYVMYDYDDDGIAERRHVIKCGSVVIENEPFDHIPFAGFSAIQMPHNIIGKSRAEIVSPEQRLNTVTIRNLLDNQTQVANGRTFINDKYVNQDDLLASYKNGVVRVDGQPAMHVMPDPVLYNGEKILQVIQFMESRQSRMTGSMISNQALTSDTLNQETATRFDGMRDMGTGKIELIARNIAEIGYRDLYEGLHWFARHYQDSEQEIYVLGRQMTINPGSWRFEHNIQSMVGTGAGDTEKAIETLGSIFAIQTQEKAAGSPLVDDAKRYNTLKQIARASGLDVMDYFNDPARDDNLLMFENEQLKLTLQDAQMKLDELTQNNPLADAEKIRAEAALLVAQSRKSEADQKDIIKMQEMENDMKQFLITAKQNKEKLDDDLVMKLTELELKYSTNIPGAAV